MALTDFTQSLVSVSSGALINSFFREGDCLFPVVILLHGFPQNSLMWKNFVGEVPSEYPVFIPDLPSYGSSVKELGNVIAHSKRAWAKDILEAIDQLTGDPLSRLIPFGHDRGARLAYRIALDFSDRVAGAAVLDIVPTSFVWDAMKLHNQTHRETKSSWHWVFLSSPSPIPETLISTQAEFFYSTLMERWTGADARERPDWRDWCMDAVHQYIDPVMGQSRIGGACEDYRAGASYDITHDLEAGVNPDDPKSVFTVPLLVLSSVHLRKRFPVDEIWQSLAPEGMVRSYQIGGERTGHFLVNEEPAEVGQRMRGWLKDILNV